MTTTTPAQPVWKPTTSFMDNFVHNMHPANYSIFDYLGLATSGYAAGFAKVLANGEPLLIKNFAARITDQFKDPATVAGFHGTGIWAFGSMKHEATAASPEDSNAGLKDLAASGANIAVTIIAGAALLPLIPEIIGVAIVASLLGFAAQKATQSAIQQWDAQHALDSGTEIPSTGDGTQTLTHHSYPNGDYFNEGSDGYREYFDAASNTKTMIRIDGSYTIQQFDSQKNLLIITDYDNEGNSLSTSIPGVGEISFDGNHASITTASGEIHSIAGSSDSGSTTLQIDQGETIIFDNTAPTVTIVDSSGGEASVKIDIAGESITYDIIAADGTRTVQSISPDGNTTKAIGYSSDGSETVETTKTNMPDGSLNFQSYNVSDGSRTSMTISADGNYTHIVVRNADGSMSETTLVPGNGDAIKSTVNKVLFDGERSSEIDQLNSGTGEIITEWKKIISADGSISIITKDDRTATFDLRDAIGNKEYAVFNADGTSHVEWTSEYGTTGSKTVKSDGTITEDVFVHMQGVDLWGESMNIITSQREVLPFQQNMHFTSEIHSDGTKTETLVTTVIGGFVESGGTQVYDHYPNAAPFWLQYPTQATPGIWVDRVGNDRVIFNYTYDPMAERVGTDTVNIDIKGRVHPDDSLSGFSGAVFLGVNGNLYTGSGYLHTWPSEEALWDFYASKLKGQMPILEAPDQDGVLKLPSFSAPFESDHGGPLPEYQQNVHLTGTSDLTVTANGLDDLIVANDGNDTIIAGVGKSTLVGGIGHTTFVTGSGESTIIGGAGSMEIQYVAGSGDLTVKNTSINDSIYFDSITSSNDLEARVITQPDGTTIYSLTLATGETIALHGSANPLERLTFSDGSTTTLSQLLLDTDEDSASASSSESVNLATNVVKMTLTGDDSITARGNGLKNIIIANDAGDILIDGGGGSMLVAGKGEDTLIGNFGQISGGITTFVHGVDAGHTTIQGSDSFDVLQFGQGIVLADVYKILSRNEKGTVVSYVINSGAAVDIQGNQYGMYGVGYLQFLDGTKTSIYELETAVRADGPLRISHTESGAIDILLLSKEGSNIHLGNSNANVTGSSGADQFYAGDGKATFTGNGGSDQFVSGRGDAEFIGGGDGSTFVISEDSGNVYISGADRSDLIIIEGDASNANVSALAIFQPDGNVVYKIAIPGRGTVTLDSKNGKLPSSIQFGEFGEFTSLSKLLLASDPNATQSSDSASFVPKGVVQLTLIGSKSLTVQGNELNDIIIANDGDDTLIAGSGRTTLVAGHGDNTLIGNHGDTIYSVAADNGKTILVNSAQGDQIVFGPGITESDLQTIEAISTDGQKIISIISPAGLSIELRPDVEGNVVQDTLFADGTRSYVGSLQKLVVSDVEISVRHELDGTYSIAAVAGSVARIQAGSSDMTIYANDSGDTLVSGSGNDTLVTGKGDDTLIGGRQLATHQKTTYFYSNGSGNAHIEESSVDDTLKFGDEFKQVNLHKISSFDKMGNHIDTLVLGDKSNITILHGDRDNDVLDSIEFSDGSSTTLSSLEPSVEASGQISIVTSEGGPIVIDLANNSGQQVTIYSGNAIVNGSVWSDIFVGGSGNTTFNGGAWDDFISGTGDSIFVGGEGSNYNILKGSGHVSIIAGGDFSSLLLDEKIMVSDVSAHVEHLQDDVINYIIDIQGQGSISLSLSDSGRLPDLEAISDDGSGYDSFTLSTLLLATDPSATVFSDHDLITPEGVVKVILTGSSALTVVGNGLDDILVANEGDDTLIAGSGYTTLIAGHGSNTLVGNGGSTVYEYALGSGVATVLKSASGDTISLGEGITFDDLSATVMLAANGSEVVDIFVSSSTSMLIQVDEAGERVDDIMLFDGSYVSLSGILSGHEHVALVGQAPELAHI